MIPNVEPSTAGLIVSLINKCIVHNIIVCNLWSTTSEGEKYDEEVSSANTTISDLSLETHVHIH